MEIDETGQNDPRHLDRRVGRADALRRASSLGTTRTAHGKSAPSAANRSKSLRGHPTARKRRVHLHIDHVPGRCIHQTSDSVVRSPLERMFEFGMRGRHRHSTFRVVVFSRVRLKTLMSGTRH
ncbi:hypothetical protein IVB18_06195 [Bradyrhizobium sp. 186]|uniref:hypothetical protein n=1 Tax=Bradyrhizobium sp. 186 TaxID=2782654 RepID=UPI00200125EA|nr:hypothetical protein [Bradyrhizobium sp. 186]UPK36916.1 hypothetical protein IVB18_06195 [Bradyrhizobium sp. 186]